MSNNDHMTNVLIQAVNGPLQQRTNVLDLDSTRANTFPIDYDTDIEYAWSDLSEILLICIMLLFEILFLQNYLQMETIFHGKQFKQVETHTIRCKQ